MRFKFVIEAFYNISNARHWYVNAKALSEAAIAL
jgi:hypothetical protein